MHVHIYGEEGTHAKKKCSLLAYYFCVPETHIYIFLNNTFLFICEETREKIRKPKKMLKYTVQCIYASQRKNVEFFTKKIIIAQYGCIFIICNFILLGKFASLKKSFFSSSF